MITLSRPLAHQILNNFILKIDINPFLVKYYFMKFRKFFNKPPKTEYLLRITLFESNIASPYLPKTYIVSFVLFRKLIYAFLYSELSNYGKCRKWGDEKPKFLDWGDFYKRRYLMDANTLFQIQVRILDPLGFVSLN